MTHLQTVNYIIVSITTDLYHGDLKIVKRMQLKFPYKAKGSDGIERFTKNKHLYSPLKLLSIVYCGGGYGHITLKIIICTAKASMCTYPLTVAQYKQVSVPIQPMHIYIIIKLKIIIFTIYFVIKDTNDDIVS